MNRKVFTQIAIGSSTVLACWLMYGRVYVSNVSLTPDVVNVEFEKTSADEATLEGHVEIVNSTKGSVRLLGVSPSCGCVHLGKWPRTIGPHETVKIGWNVTKGGFVSDQEIRIFSDCRSAPVLVQSLHLVPSHELKKGE